MCWISQRSASVSLPTLHSNFIFNWRRHKFISHRTFAWRMSWREMKGKSVEQSHLVCGILQLHCIQKMNCIQHQQTTTCEHKNKPTICVCSGKLNCDALMISFLSLFFFKYLPDARWLVIRCTIWTGVLSHRSAIPLSTGYPIAAIYATPRWFHFSTDAQNFTIDLNAVW